MCKTEHNYVCIRRNIIIKCLRSQSASLVVHMHVSLVVPSCTHCSLAPEWCVASCILRSVIHNVVHTYPDFSVLCKQRTAQTSVMHTILCTNKFSLLRKFSALLLTCEKKACRLKSKMSLWVRKMLRDKQKEEGE